MSRSSDLRFTEYVLPSQVSPVTDFRPERFSTLTAAVPFVIHTRFTILSERFIAQRSTQALTYFSYTTLQIKSQHFFAQILDFMLNVEWHAKF